MKTALSVLFSLFVVNAHALIDHPPTNFVIFSTGSGSGQVVHMSWDWDGNYYNVFSTYFPSTISSFSGFTYFAGPVATNINIAATNSTGVTLFAFGAANVSGQMRWVQPYMSSSPVFTDTKVTSIAADSSGNATSVGFFHGNSNGGVNFGPIALTNHSSVIGMFMVKQSPLGNVTWATNFSSTNTAGDVSAKGVVCDSSDNIIVIGFYRGNCDFGGIILTNDNSFTSNYQDTFLAKYSSAGALIWAKRFGGNIAESGYAVKLDSSDNIYITGTMSSATVDFNGVTATNPSPGYASSFIVKLNSSGSGIWAKCIGRVTGAFSQIISRAIAVDVSGNAFIAGEFTGVVNFGGSNRTNNGNYGYIFVAKYSTVDGSYSWDSIAGNGTSPNIAYAVAFDTISQNVWITGGYSGNINFGGGGQISTDGGQTPFLAGYTGTTGSNFWVRGFGGSGTVSSDAGYGLAIDSTGVLVFTGLLRTPTEFGYWPDQGGFFGSGYFVATYTLSGTQRPAYRWAYLSPQGISQGNAVAFDSTGNELVGGYFTGTTLFGTTNITPNVGDTAGFINNYTR